MSQNPRVEELSDSDSDPPEDDLTSFTTAQPTVSSFRHRLTQPQPQQQREVLQPLPPSFPNHPIQTNPPSDHKTYCCLYPLYFDASRTRSEGRRVGKDQAVKNPLAREIVDAVQTLGLKSVFEPGKMHPKDWGNPGRVRVGLKVENGGGRGRVKNKHHLYNLVSAYLKSHPTTAQSPLRLRIQGMPLPDGPVPPPAVPKGYKINEILPLHSPALSGGGVSENIMKDVLQEMQGQGSGGIHGLLDNSMEGGGGGISGAAQGKRKREGGRKK
ncbi:MAG: hypothetical protein Q9217_002205 [Psora testacea]